MPAPLMIGTRTGLMLFHPTVTMKQIVDFDSELRRGFSLSDSELLELARSVFQNEPVRIQGVQMSEMSTLHQRVQASLRDAAGEEAVGRILEAV
jgi:hypothetical protein